MPWSKIWSLIEMPLLFLPRWWPAIILLLPIIINSQLVIAQKKKVLLTITLIIFFYLDFHVPVKKFITKSTEKSFQVMSINLGGKIKNPAAFKEYLIDNQLSLIAFQETPEREAKKITPQGWDLHCIGQMCLASAYKLKYIDSQSRKFFGGWGQLGLLYQTKINNQTVNVMNLHLETPRKGFEDFQLSKLNFEVVFKNTEQRYLESNIIASWLKNKTPTIILGDFNMPVESSIYRENFSIYKNAFNEAGFGFGFTKFTRLLGVRIDHILISNNFNVLDAKVNQDFGSDHKAILAELMFD